MNMLFGGLKKDIEEKRKELDKKIEQQAKNADILKVSEELDDLIMVYQHKNTRNLLSKNIVLTKEKKRGSIDT